MLFISLVDARRLYLTGAIVCTASNVVEAAGHLLTAQCLLLQIRHQMGYEAFVSLLVCAQ